MARLFLHRRERQNYAAFQKIDERGKSVIKNMEETNRNIGGNIGKTNETLAMWSTALTMLVAVKNSGASVSKSPFGLSEKGKKISRNINTEEIINSRLDEFMSGFESLSSSCDIREKAVELGESIYDDLPEDVKNSVKNEIYQSAPRLFQVCPIFSIRLRDAILKERETGGRRMGKTHAAQPST